MQLKIRDHSNLSCQITSNKQYTRFLLWFYESIGVIRYELFILYFCINSCGVVDIKILIGIYNYVRVQYVHTHVNCIKLHVKTLKAFSLKKEISKL